MSISWWLYGTSLILDWGIVLERPKKNDKIFSSQVFSKFHPPHGIPMTYAPENLYSQIIRETSEQVPPNESEWMNWGYVFRILLTLSDSLGVCLSNTLGPATEV